MPEHEATYEQKDIPTKILALIPRLVHVFEGLEAFLPFSIADQHPHILARLNLLWPSDQAGKYLTELMVPNRSDRSGFHPSVIKEILFLSDLHKVIYPPSTTSASDFITNPLEENFGPLTVSDLVVRRNLLESSIGKRLQEHQNIARLQQERVKSWGELNSLDELHQFWASQMSRVTVKKDLLGAVLARYGIVTADTIDLALELQAMSNPKHRPKLGHILVDANICSKQDIFKALVIQANIPLINLDLVTGAVDALSSITLDIAKELAAYPVLKIGKILFVAVENPLTFAGKSTLSVASNLSIALVFSRRELIEARLRNLV